MDLTQEQIDNMLETLNDEERAQVLSILDDFIQTGSSEKFQALIDKDFEEIPVDIETFIKDPEYLGGSYVNEQGKCIIYPFWIDKFKELFRDGKTNFNEVILTGAIGLGKAQPLTSKVLCEDGYMLMKDVKVGTRVWGADGKLHTVIGVFPQGVKDIYEVVFNDGSSTRCCKEHLWNIACRSSSSPYEYVTMPLSDIIDKPLYKEHKSLNCKVWQYYIPVTKPLEFEKNTTIIDPYIIGALIGDGNLSNNALEISCYDDEVRSLFENKISRYDCELQLVSKSHPEIKDYSIKVKGAVKGHLNHSSVKNSIREEIKRCRLNCHSYSKFIPKDYLFSDVQDRVSLLQGLMDTDGTIENIGTIYYSTTSKQLALDVQFLVHSLGGTARIKCETNRIYKYREEIRACRDNYNIYICLPKSIIPFTCTRKLNRLLDNRKEPFRNIRSITKVGEEECQCIKLDSVEELYLTDDCIVTHNTTIAVVGTAYTIYKLMCLKNPQQYYEQKPNSKIYVAFFNITLELSYGVAYKDLQEALIKSPWFSKRGTVSGRKNLVYTPSKGIEFMVGSKPEHALGKNVFCLSGDTEVRLSDNTYKAIKDIDSKVAVYNTLENVIEESRFMHEGVNTKNSKSLIKVTLEDGTTFICSPSHRFLLSNGKYKSASRLKVGDDFQEINKPGKINEEK